VQDLLVAATLAALLLATRALIRLCRALEDRP
jgi:hypothetical protein